MSARCSFYCKRLVKAPKVYFSDTALLLHILNLNAKQLKEHLNILGCVVENFLIMELVKQASWSDSTPTLSHYRQEREKGTEVDVVLESDGKIIGIEIKLSSVVRSNDLKGLHSLKNIAGKAFSKGIVLYMGNRILPLGEGFQAVPINALWTS